MHSAIHRPRLAATFVLPRKEASMFSQQLVRSALLRTLAALLLLVTSAGAAGVSAGQATTASHTAASSVTAKRACDPLTDFSSDNFSNPTKIDNTWSPLVPGTQFILEGQANRGGGLLPHRVVFTVTDLTKVINGVRTRVLWDVDYN